MASRNTRYWHRFLQKLLAAPDAPGSETPYDGLCVLTPSGRVEYRDGCFRPLDVDPLQLLAVFEQLTRQAIQEEQRAHDPAAPQPTQSLTPALRLGECVFHVVSASFSSVCAVASGQSRGLVAEKLPFGVLLVAFSAPLRLEAVFGHLERACAALRC